MNEPTLNNGSVTRLLQEKELVGQTASTFTSQTKCEAESIKQRNEMDKKVEASKGNAYKCCY